MTTFYWFAIFLIIGVAGLVFVIVQTRSALDEVSDLIKDRRMNEAVNCYCDWGFTLLIYVIVFSAITTGFIFALR